MKPITTLTIALLLPLLSWSQVKCPCDMSTARKVDSKTAEELCDATQTGANINSYMFETRIPITNFQKVIEVNARLSSDCIKNKEQYNACIADWIRYNYKDLSNYTCITDRYKGHALVAFLGRNNHAGMEELLEELEPFGLDYLTEAYTAQIAIEGEWSEKKLNLLDVAGYFALYSLSDLTVTNNCILVKRLKELGISYSDTGGITPDMERKIDETCEDEEEIEDDF